MPFKKGQSGNLKGKPSGTLNKTTKEFKDIIQGLLQNELQFLPERIKNLSDRDKVNVTFKLMEYAVPKIIKEDAEQVKETTLDQLIREGIVTIVEEKTLPKIKEEFKSLK